MTTRLLNRAPAGTNGGRRTSDGLRTVAHVNTDSTLTARGRQVSALLENACYLESLHGEQAEYHARRAAWHSEQAARARRQRAQLESLAFRPGGDA